MYWEVAPTITTPNLVCLHLTCVAQLIFSVEAPNLLEANLSLKNFGNKIKFSYMALVCLLSNLNFLKKMVLSVLIEEVLIVPKSIRKKCDSPLPNLDHLKVKIRYSRDKTAELLDSLLWCAEVSKLHISAWIK